MKNLSIISLLMLSIVVTSCRVTIPERDSVFPEFLFHIRGGGLNEKIDETFDFDNKVLYLKRNDSYKVLFSAGDQGGMDEIAWELPIQRIVDITTPSPFPGGWGDRSTLAERRVISWRGDRSDPRTGSVINIDFIPMGDTMSGVEEFDFILSARDYFGNRTVKSLTVRIHNEGPRIGTR